MPVDRSVLATPTLMRSARGTYARSIRAHLHEAGIDDLPRNGAFILFGVRSGDEAREDHAAVLGVSKQAVSQVIDVLVNRGYLVRNPDPTDRRRITLELTGRGEEAVAAVWRGTDAVDQQLAARVSPERVDAMRSGLMALADIKAETPSAGGKARRMAARRFRQFSPIFPVRDLEAALAHYTSLGFKTFADEDGGQYGFAERDGVSLHLALASAHHGGGDAVGMTYLYVRDADALYDEWSRPGIGGVTRAVGPTPYGLREGSHDDADGNRIRFGSPMEVEEE